MEDEGNIEWFFYTTTYCQCLYVSATIITTTGYGDVFPNSNSEMCTLP